jgi:metal-sulfur cluster biosynthetic enzyme
MNEAEPGANSGDDDRDEAKSALEEEIAARPDTREKVAEVRRALRGVSDPELGINIVDLGLVYDVEIEEELARVTMTLTSPGCPAGGEIMGNAKMAAESVEGVTEAEVNLVWKPFWTPDRIDPKVRAMMGY